MPLVIEINDTPDRSAVFAVINNPGKLRFQHSVFEGTKHIVTVLPLEIKDVKKVADFINAWLERESEFSSKNIMAEVKRILEKK